MPITTSVVSTGCSTASQRHRLLVVAMIPSATMTAQPMCSDGIAAYWSASVFWVGGPYTAGP